MRLRPRSTLSLQDYLQVFPSQPRVIVFDLETTGLDPRYDEIVEVGAVELTNLVETRSFSQLANPTKLIPNKVRAVHGLSNYLLRSMPNTVEVLRLFMEWLGPDRDFLMVGHNVQFDIRFLKAGIEHLNSSCGTAFSCDFKEFCTMQFLDIGFSRTMVSLDLACRLFGVDEYKTRGLHSAIVDARLTGLLFTKLKLWDFFQDTKGIKLFPAKKIAKYRPRPEKRVLPEFYREKKVEEVTEEQQKAKESAKRKFSWMRSNWKKGVKSEPRSSTSYE